MRISRNPAIIIGLILLFFTVSAIAYPRMPETIASHWNSSGEADGFVSGFWGVFLLPAIVLGMAGLLLVLPKIGPVAKGIENQKNSYYLIVIVFLVFMFYLHLLTIAWNLGTEFDMTMMLAPGAGAVYYVIGILIPRLKPNRMAGIRTPWTLKSDSVWEKTHRLGGSLFKIAGLLAATGIFFKDWAFLIIFLPVLLVTAYVVYYSYHEYKKEFPG